MQTSSKKFFHCFITGIVCILFICSLPVSSFAVGSYTSNQLGSSTDELNFYKLIDFYNSNVVANSSNWRNYGYNCNDFEYLALSPNRYYDLHLWGIGETLDDYFDDYVYIYYPGCLTMLNINSDIVTYNVVSTVYSSGSDLYYTLGFSWYSSNAYCFEDFLVQYGDNHGSVNDPDYYVESTFNGVTRRMKSSAVLKPSVIYDYDSSSWVSGTGSVSSDWSILPYGLTGSELRSYDSLLGHFHYINLVTFQRPNDIGTSTSLTELNSLFHSYTDLNYDIAQYTSVFCPGIDIDDSILNLSLSNNEFNSNDTGYFANFFTPRDKIDLNPAEYISDIVSDISGGGYITTSEIKNNTATTVPTTTAPYTRPDQTRPNMTTSPGGSDPGPGGGSESTSSSESSSDENSEVISALDDVASGIANITGHVSNTDVSSYIPSSSDSYGDLLSNVDEAVGALSSRGNDLSSVCGQAEVFVDDVFGALPSLVIAAISCAAIILFVCKVVNR